jgi:hypothetical protein
VRALKPETPGKENLKMIVCSECGLSPFDGRALFRDKGALFHNGKSIRGVGPLFCAFCAPKKIKAAIAASTRIDAATKALAA